MADVFEQRIQDVITEIVQFAPQLQGLALELRAKIANLEAERATDELKLDENYWTIVCYADALIRMRLIVEQNFRFVETLGLLAVTRFLFETVVWLRVLRRDRRFGLTYRFQIIEKQLSYYRDFRKKLESEIDMLISLGEEEGDKVTALALAAINESPSESSHIGEELKAIEMEIDRKARRNFCLYAESAKTNGHGFQAELIKTKVLPDIIVRIETLEKERSEFLAHITGRPPTSTSWEKQSRDWKWKAQAESVGMLGQYEFIYSYTSRLLHATPVSMTTNQKLLETSEVYIFLEYIFISILDSMDLASEVLEK